MDGLWFILVEGDRYGHYHAGPIQMDCNTAASQATSLRPRWGASGMAPFWLVRPRTGPSASGPNCRRSGACLRTLQTRLATVDCLAPREHAERYGKISDFGPRKSQQNQRC